jgi:hypothetical protein
MDDKLERPWKETPWLNLKYIRSLFPEGIEEN